MTNGDKIRDMSNEELATLLSKDSLWLRYFHPQYCELVAENLNPGFCDDDCYECVLEWLNKESNINKKPDFTNHTGNALDYPN